jgi:FMNH2-dependent dimethyl sulfone monooxygenase
LQTTWPTTLAWSQIADRDGFETLVPVARSRGFGRETNFNGTNVETYTWAAGLGALTEQICVMTTSHAPTVHPLFAAKQGATIDHLTNGLTVTSQHS